MDNAAGYYLQAGEIDLVITGADRIANNGDAANKIGTYEKAVLASENGVPFYIAAPISTFDLSLKSGKEIPIEERNHEEGKKPEDLATPRVRKKPGRQEDCGGQVHGGGDQEIEAAHVVAGLPHPAQAKDEVE